MPILPTKQTLRILIIAFILLIVIITGFVVFVHYRFIYQKVSLDQLNLKTPPFFLALLSPVQEGYREINMIRLKDGKKQPFLSREWHVDFANNGDAFVYGRFKEDEEREGYELFYIKKEGLIDTYTLSRIQGEIISILENPQRTYLIAKTTTNQASAYCLIELNPKKPPEVCSQLASGQLTDERWNPQKQDELVIKLRKSDKIYLFDTTVKKAPQEIIEDVEPEKYQELLALFSKDYNPRYIYTESSNEKRGLWKMLNLAIVRDKAGWSFTQVPLFSKISWFADENHLIIKEHNHLSIFEIDNHKQAKLLEKKEISWDKIEFRNKDFDQVL